MHDPIFDEMWYRAANFELNGSPVTKYIFFKFKMADGRYIEKCSKCYNSSTSEAIWTKLGGHIPSSPRHVRHDAVAMVTAVAQGRFYVGAGGHRPPKCWLVPRPKYFGSNSKNTHC